MYPQYYIVILTLIVIGVRSLIISKVKAVNQKHGLYSLSEASARK